MAYDRIPAVDENYNFPGEVLDALVKSAQLRNVPVTLTTAQRDALAGANLWDGRVIMNTTTDRLNVYDQPNLTWVVVPNQADLAVVQGQTILSYTTAQRDALAGVNLWDGRVIFNTSTKRLNRYSTNTVSWKVLVEYEDLYTDRPLLIVKRLATQNLAAAGYHQIVWDNVVENNGFVSPLGGSQITIPKTGLYETQFRSSIITSTGFMMQVLKVNGGGAEFYSRRSVATNGSPETNSAGLTYRLSQGDLVEAELYVANAGATSNSGLYVPRFELAWVRP